MLMALARLAPSRPLISPSIIDRSSNERRSRERSTCFAWVDLNHIINSRAKKWLTYAALGVVSNIRHVTSCKTVTLLLVNCHDVTGGISDRWIWRQTGMKSPLKWPTNQKKKFKGLWESLGFGTSYQNISHHHQQSPSGQYLPARPYTYSFSAW